MTDEVKRLKIKLGTIKTRLTKFVTFISVPENRTKIIEVKKRLELIEPSLKDFEDVYTKILENDESQIQESELTDFENRYFTVVSEVEGLLLNSVGVSPPSPSQSTADLLTNPVNIPIKLPAINLDKFSGSFTEWLTFRDSFKSLIHNNENLNPIQKFHYLKASVAGDTKQTIDHLTPSIDNYASAWGLLETRYENERLITQYHVRALFSLPQIHHKDSKGLRTLLHSVTSNIKSLESINRPVDQWDDLLVYLISSKFDNNTTIAWESTLSNNLPTLYDIIRFLTQRCQMLESIESNNLINKNNNQSRFTNSSSSNSRGTSHVTINSNNKSQQKCTLCKEQHYIYNCTKLLNLSIEQRIQEIKKHKLCTNCLRAGHKVDECTSSNCKKCNKRHNSLLHIESRTQQFPNNSEPQSSPNLIATTANHAESFNKNIILSTAMISIPTNGGKKLKLRALLDNGSASNFITERAVKKLKLSHIQKIDFSITGITCSMAQVDKAVNIDVYSNHTNFNCKLNCLIVPEITGKIPFTSFKPLCNIPGNIRLADPTYFQSNSIDVLIGNEIFWTLINVGKISIEKHGPVLQKTQLGWIVSGPISTNRKQNAIQCNLSNIQLNENIQNFLNVEDLPNNKTFVNDPCEEHFLHTHSREPCGRFKVKLPLINDPPLLGQSYHRVLKMFHNLERRLNGDSNLYAQYREFMETYLTLGHMSEISQPDFSGYFLSHHPVLNPGSATTKLRVVFNGSFKTSNNMSINDNLYVGQNLQQDLFSILLRFRIHKIVITADIKKMYRQILVHEDHRIYQQIFWRNNINEPMKVYQLNTVTYGLAPCSFLATRCLQEVASTEAENYSNASDVILRDSYVDDIISGSDSETEAQSLLSDLITVLGKGKFELHKINSNCSSLMPRCDSNSQSSNEICLDKQTISKTLGVLWNRAHDSIEYATHLSNSKSLKVTKRGILSVIARIFDPLGLVGPVTITAKIILQKIWSLNLNWDESLPSHLHTMWTEFLNNFHDLMTISIPRRAIVSKKIVEIHAFCDSSQSAYGACVYLRTKISDQTYNTQLLCAKSKLAPLKSLTIPRLELCGALLLAQLVDKVKSSLNITIHACHYWSDSTIVLAWIRTSPNKLKPFVSHRITKIQKLTSENDWHHISSNENPADILSRGVNPSQLKTSSLWWQGPTFLNTNNKNFVASDENINFNDKIPELKSICCLSISKPKFDILTKFKSFQKLLRVTALCLRFIHNLKHKNNKFTGILTCEEIEQAHNIVVKLVQHESFHIDIHNLNKHNQVTSNSKIKSLNPYLDKHGLLRVGGRLENSNLSADQKHQLLLPKNHNVTNIIISQYHTDNLHSGCQATLAAIRQKYWPISAKNNIRKIIFRCIKCYRLKPIPYQQLMADLPKDRVTPTRPFSVTGVDYAGPFTLKNGHGRTTKTIKGYVAIFVCFSTRAVHIELVCECTSSAFLNALKRFMSRRGKPHKMYSDNGTNFVGANHHLKELYNLVKAKEFENTVINSLTNQKIQWSFIPPRAPHMGGLWEASVKSLKSHMKRVLGNALLNYEEMYTVLTMIEACMNSRPITPLSNDPNDRSALTPGHFLIGDSLTAHAEPNLVETPMNRLSRYQRLEQLRQHFWKRWSSEYLHQLQQRYKWNSCPSKQPQPGDLVIIKEDNSPPLHWPLGRITATHPGADGQCRVVSVKSVRGVTKRPVSKVCAVPID